MAFCFFTTGELVTPLGLETLLVHGKYLYESHDIASAEAVYRECCNLTKRDVEVPNDLPELMFARLDTLFQLLLASGQPEMALGVAKERVAQEKKYPNDPSAGIGLILFGLAKQEIGGKAEVVQKTEKKKKGKKTAAAAAAPKKEWLVQEDGNETVLDESTGMDEVRERLCVCFFFCLCCLFLFQRFWLESGCQRKLRSCFAITVWRKSVIWVRCK